MYSTLNQLSLSFESEPTSSTRITHVELTSTLSNEMCDVVINNILPQWMRANGGFEFMSRRVRDDLTMMIADALVGQFERNDDGTIRSNCTRLKMRDMIANNDTLRLASMLDSHCRLKTKAGVIVQNKLKSCLKIDSEVVDIDDILHNVDADILILNLKKLVQKGEIDAEEADELARKFKLNINFTLFWGFHEKK